MFVHSATSDMYSRQTWKHHAMSQCKIGDSCKDYSREAREGWPLVVNRDSKSTNESAPSSVGLLGLSCRYKRFLSALAVLAGPGHKKVSSLYNIYVHLSRREFITVRGQSYVSRLPKD
jgi:hypothetical protein